MKTLKNKTNIELTEITEDDKKNMTEFVSENIDDFFSVPWKVSALINEIVDFVRENENARSI